MVNECENTMSREEAEAYRKELMDERSVAIDKSNYFDVVSPLFDFPPRWVV